MKKLPAFAALLLAACGSPPPPRPLFRDAAAESGLLFTHDADPTSEHYLPEIMGSGCALLDYDNDGDLDVFLIQGKPGSGNRLFRNDGMRFRDVSAESGLGKSMTGMGAATGDFDNDGWVDLYVTAYGPNALYRNNGNGTFTDVTAQAGVQDERWSTSAAFLDYDRDGDLDLFVLNYVDFAPANNKRCTAPSGEPDYCTPKAYKPVPARLFHNESGGRFRDVTVASGIGAKFGPGLGVTVADLNADRWLDIYVANDTDANLLWINRRDGTFAEQGLEAGAAYSEDGLARAGMGVTAGDFDADSDDDLFVVNLTREGATLFANDGKGGFQDIGLRSGIRPATLPFTGFGTDWIDFDNDGWLDLFIANGAVTRIDEQRGSSWPFAQRNSLLRNVQGKRFEAAAVPGQPEVGRGAAFGDIDNDGDVDILVTNNNGPVRLWINESPRSGDWISVKLEGVKSNRMGLGARAGLVRNGQPTLWRRVHTDSSYLSASDPRVHFGLGGEALLVEWPDGTRERWDGPTRGRVIVLRQGESHRKL